MNVRPLYDRIIVKRIDEGETTRNGIVIPDSAQEKPQQGEVIAIGRGRGLEDGTVAKITVSVGTESSSDGSPAGIRDAGGDFLIMREDDVLGILSVPAQPGEKAK